MKRGLLLESEGNFNEAMIYAERLEAAPRLQGPCKAPRAVLAMRFMNEISNMTSSRSRS